MLSSLKGLRTQMSGDGARLNCGSAALVPARNRGYDRPLETGQPGLGERPLTAPRQTGARRRLSAFYCLGAPSGGDLGRVPSLNSSSASISAPTITTRALSQNQSSKMTGAASAPYGVVRPEMGNIQGKESGSR